MDNKLEKIFTNFANSHEDSLLEMGFSKESFIKQAKEWSETDDGKLEIQKFILQQEIADLEDEISKLKDSIDKKFDSIKEIDNELDQL